MNIREEAEIVIEEIFSKARIGEGDIFVVGCSSSEIIGNRMGTSKDGETDAVVETLYDVLSSRIKAAGAYMAVQCCEHLNRAIVLEKEVADRFGFNRVNVIPMPHAGGAFAVKHFSSLKNPVVVEDIRAMAVAGLDVGGVMIGMHIKPVVVPIRLDHKKIGEATVLAGRYRPKYIGGERAVYDPELE